MSDEELYERILRKLEIDHMYVDHFDPGDVEEIALVRSLGRKAGRHFGWKVRTVQTDPSAGTDGKVVVVVAVIQSTPEDDARLSERGNFLREHMDLALGLE